MAPPKWLIDDFIVGDDVDLPNPSIDGRGCDDEDRFLFDFFTEVEVNDLYLFDAKLLLAKGI